MGSIALERQRRDSIIARYVYECLERDKRDESAPIEKIEAEALVATQKFYVAVYEAYGNTPSADVRKRVEDNVREIIDAYNSDPGSCPDADTC